MPWFKIDDSLWGHPKWLNASPAARALWVTAGSWCMAQVQDGKVPSIVLPMLGGKPKNAAELVAVGLWEELPDGWLFHDWHDYQPSREQIETDRHAARERQRRARDKAKSHRESRRDTTVTHDDETALVTVPPTRPDPTVVPDGTTKSGKRRAPETPLPESWKPNQTHREYAEANGLDLSAEAFRFRNHAIANDRRQRRWDATFTTWLSRAKDFAPKRQQSALAERIDLPEAWR
jgi:hypothetical protein